MQPLDIRGGGLLEAIALFSHPLPGEKVDSSCINRFKKYEQLCCTNIGSRAELDMLFESARIRHDTESVR